jgi:hypothetical protein
MCAGSLCVAARDVEWRDGVGAAWREDFVSKADAVSNAHFSVHLSSAATQYGDCRIEQMAAAGAPADPVNFAREFARQNLNEVVVMRSFRNIGAVDLESVIFGHLLFLLGIKTLHTDP